MQDKKPHPLTGRRLYIPRMSTGGARAMAAAFQSAGVDAHVSPESDDETLALAARFTTGEECLPQRVTLGNFLKVINEEGFNPEKNAFFMPTSSGPCRFGQYAPFFKSVLKELNLEDVVVFDPTSSDGYGGIAANSLHFLRSAWRSVLAGDILRKLLLMFRPYESIPGRTDDLHVHALDRVCAILSDGSLSSRDQQHRLVDTFEEIRDDFLHVPLKEPLGSRPVVGIVGEIYLRFNTFSNQNMLRRVEAQGAETWIAPVAEWVWYTNSEEKRRFREAGKRISLSILKARLRHWVEHMEEKKLFAPFDGLFSARREAEIETLLHNSRPYLPANMALGEMTLNAGNSISFYHAGCSGVADICPFTCMNGIVTEVIYPHISRDHGDIPIRVFYFDGVPFDLDGDLEIFMDQVKAYHKKKFRL
jgi:predicted nucleotide-binding protein (sugar kinase/HSP70/actin superfamily)